MRMPDYRHHAYNEKGVWVQAAMLPAPGKVNASFHPCHTSSFLQGNRRWWKNPLPSVTQPGYIATILMYIDQNLSNELNIELLSGIIHVNRYYFSTFFKKYVGETPIQYITRKRIAMAIQLLQTTNLGVLEIANQCGFKNAANFNRIFKQIVAEFLQISRKRNIKQTIHTFLRP